MLSTLSQKTFLIVVPKLETNLTDMREGDQIPSDFSEVPVRPPL